MSDPNQEAPRSPLEPSQAITFERAGAKREEREFVRMAAIACFAATNPAIIDMHWAQVKINAAYAWRCARILWAARREEP